MISGNYTALRIKLILFFRYTSLGHHSDTLPNPRLKLPDGSFQPAHLLSDGSFERDGRVKKV